MSDTYSSLAEMHPPLTKQEALVESHRCLYCYDAPCTHACPTHIDIPRFIKKIATGNVTGSARAIFDSNLIGATCARVCPVQELCEGACVLGSEQRPIAIGRLQRYAMDHAYGAGQLPFQPAVKAGAKKIAVVGSGPAGLSCAGELARRGHAVTLFEKRDLAGGLSTFGIIGLREPIPVAQAEVALMQKLGVNVETQRELGVNLDFDALRREFDAVFLGTGLGATPSLGIPGEDRILDGLAYIEESKLAPQQMKIGQSVVVIGAGNTAIDCATVARRLGAARVTMVYRRTANEMTAYRHEYEFVKNEGVAFEFLAVPKAVVDGGLECVRMQLSPANTDASGRPVPVPVAGSEFVIACDQIVKAIGQQKPPLAVRLGLRIENGYIAVSDSLATSIDGVWAGGDAIRVKGAASTVMAVQDGKLAAVAIDRALAQEGRG